MIPRATAEQYEAQQAIAATTVAALDTLWRRMDDDFDKSWQDIRPTALDLVGAGRAAAVRSAIEYTPLALDEMNIDAPAVAGLEGSAFLTAAPSGVAVATILDSTPIRAKQAIANGFTVAQSLATARQWLTSMSLTLMADTRREVYQADMGIRFNLSGYTRMVNMPSCRDCLILAGKWYRWNTGFDRHPHCDCTHIPANEDVAGDLTTDPYKAFESMSRVEQEKMFGASAARAIRDGADIYKVYGQTASKMRSANNRIDRIYRTAGHRTNAVKMLRERGFITDRGQVRVVRAKGVLSNEEILARGRGAGTYTLAGVTRTTNRAALYDAVKSGVRDPLRRSTMTAAERRLYDAQYKLMYAKRTGTLPRSIGMNTADAYSGAKGVPVDAKRMAQLESAVAREIAQIKPGTGMHKVYLALGMDEPAKAESVFNAIRLADAKTATGGRGGGRKPPTAARGAAAFGDPPDESDKAAWSAYWQSRQDALNSGDAGELLAPHEIEMYEWMLDREHTFELIPRERLATGAYRSTNDIRWAHIGGAEAELKSFQGSSYASIADEIQETVLSARKWGVVKDVFIIHRREGEFNAKVLGQIAKYNRRRPGARIERLFVRRGDEFVEIKLL